VVVGLAAVWGVVAVVHGDGDPAGDRSIDDTAVPRPVGSSTTAPAPRPPPSRPVSTVPSRIPGAPLLGEPVGLSALIVGWRTYLVDFDSGLVQIPRIFGIVGALGPDLLVRRVSGIERWPPPYDGTGVMPYTTLEFDQLWAVPSSSTVWVVSYPQGPDPSAGNGRARLLNRAGTVLADVLIPPEGWPVGATDAGLVLGIPGVAVILRPDGTVRELANGQPFAASGDRVHLTRCGAPSGTVACRTVIVGLDGAEHGSAAAIDPFIGVSAPSPDGRLAHVLPLAAGGSIAVDGVAVATSDAPVEAMTWSADGRWLVAVAGPDVLVIDTAGQGPPVTLQVGERAIGTTMVLLLPS
jgi:hypothetical protein